MSMLESEILELKFSFFLHESVENIQVCIDSLKNKFQ